MNLTCPRQLTDVQFERFYTAAADKLDSIYVRQSLYQIDMLVLTTYAINSNCNLIQFLNHFIQIRFFIHFGFTLRKYHQSYLLNVFLFYRYSQKEVWLSKVNWQDVYQDQDQPIKSSTLVLRWHPLLHYYCITWDLMGRLLLILSPSILTRYLATK